MVNSCNSQYFEAAKFVGTSKLLDHYLGFVMPEILLHMKKAEYTSKSTGSFNNLVPPPSKQ